MSDPHRRHRRSASRPTTSKLEWAICCVGLILSVVAGVVAYQKVGLYGDGPFSYHYYHVTDPTTGKVLLVHESHTASGIVRRVIDGTTLKGIELDVEGDGEQEEKMTKLQRAHDGCLGNRRRGRTWVAAKSLGEPLTRL